MTIGSRVREYFVHNENMKHTTDILGYFNSQGVSAKQTLSNEARKLDYSHLKNLKNSSIVTRAQDIKQPIKTKIYAYQHKNSVLGSGRIGDASTFIDTQDYFNLNKTHMGGSSEQE